MCVSRDCFSKNETQRSISDTTCPKYLLCSYFISIVLIQGMLTPAAPTLFCTKAYKYLPDNMNYRQRQKLYKGWCKIFHN